MFLSPSNLVSLRKVPPLNSRIHHPIPIDQARRANDNPPPRRLLRSNKAQRRNLRESNPTQEKHIHSFRGVVSTQRLARTDSLIVAFLDDAKRGAAGVLDQVFEAEPSGRGNARRAGGRRGGATANEGEGVLFLQDALDEADAERGEAAVDVGNVGGVLLADLFDDEAEVLPEVVVVGSGAGLGARCG